MASVWPTSARGSLPTGTRFCKVKPRGRQRGARSPQQSKTPQRRGLTETGPCADGRALSGMRKAEGFRSHRSGSGAGLAGPGRTRTARCGPGPHRYPAPTGVIPFGRVSRQQRDHHAVTGRADLGNRVGQAPVRPAARLPARGDRQRAPVKRVGAHRAAERLTAVRNGHSCLPGAPSAHLLLQVSAQLQGVRVLRNLLRVQHARLGQEPLGPDCRRLGGISEDARDLGC